MKEFYMPVLTPDTEKLIQNFDKTLENKLKIKLNLTGHNADKSFSDIMSEFNTITSKLVIETEESEQDLPGFQLGKNISYSALPLEKELEPFLESLSRLYNKTSTLPETTLKELEKIEYTVNLKLYIALHCPHCPVMVSTLVPLALHCEKINLEIIDGTLFSETARKDQVMSAPCLILDDGFRWTGSVTDSEILKMITDRDPSQLSSSTLRTILEQGDADWITEEMIKAGKIFDSFIELLLHKIWSVRLGAMVIVENLAQEAPELAQLLCPVLIDLFDDKDIAVQGDILYALGEAGNKDTFEWLKNKESDFSHPDLKDAASDALESLAERI